MPWSIERYPAAMRGLSIPVLDRAIHIANALLAEGHDDGFAIRVAIARAKAWAEHRGLPIHDPEDRRNADVPRG